MINVPELTPVEKELAVAYALEDDRESMVKLLASKVLEVNVSENRERVEAFLEGFLVGMRMNHDIQIKILSTIVKGK